MSNLYVGLMSGTSMDGIDAVLVNFSDSGIDIRAAHSHPYSQALGDALRGAANEPLNINLDVSGELNRQVGECFRDAALAVIDNSDVDPRAIIAIGSHGQTLRHQPNAEVPFSLQIGDPNIIAEGTRITTVANFRAADIAVGGQGAPLVPPFHQWLFAPGNSTGDRVVANIGGIANITILPADGGDVTGFDTGPGNGLMDAWVAHNLRKPFDEDGRWAASGQVIESLLARMQSDPYFALPPPKSTGFEYFNLSWAQRFDLDQFNANDVQATLAELTAITLADAVKMHCDRAGELYVCGGGAHNSELMQRITRNFPEATVATTAAVGLDPDWVEAVAFAWLAMRTIEGETGNLPSVTGAGQAVVLGELHYPQK